MTANQKKKKNEISGLEKESAAFRLLKSTVNIIKPIHNFNSRTAVTDCNFCPLL
jgi:hypothetical protein